MRQQTSVTPRLLLLLLAVTSVPALAQEAPTIHGRVFAVDNRAALPRARVVIVVDGEPSSPVYTDERGEFSIAAPSAPTFTLSVAKASYAAMQMPLQRAALGTASASPMAIALTPAAAVNGRVVDTFGETVVGLRVYADRLDADATVASGLKRFATNTDDRGEYRLGGLPPGRYTVTTTNALDPGAVVTLALRPGDNLSTIDFTAQPPPDSAISPTPQPPETPERATIRGRVLSATGRPITRAVVNLTGPIAPRYFLTDAQGRFTFAGLTPGDYDVRASRGDFLPGTLDQQTAFESSSRIAVSAGARVDGVTLLLSRGLAVTGSIVDRAGEPLQGVSVVALQLSASGDRQRATLAGALLGGGRQTDDRGQYRVLGLQPGRYVIAALADAASLGAGAAGSQPVPVYFPGSPSIADAVTVAITTTDVDGIDFTLGDAPAARVTGVALDSTGAPLRGSITLAVSHRSGTIVPDPRTTQSNADGAFTFFNVAPGDYVVQATRLEAPRLPQPGRLISPLDGLEFVSQHLTVGAHDADPVVLRTARGTVMDGRMVIDSSPPHDPYDRMQIEGHPVDLDLAPMRSSISAVSRVVDGRFRIPALFGTRHFALSGMPEGFYLKSLTINGADVTDQAIDFGIGGGATVAAEVVISSGGGAIVGRVTGRAASAGPVIVVFPQDREKWFARSRFVKVVRASRDGSFRAASLPPGDYYVATTAITDESAVAIAPDVLERLLPRALSLTLAEGAEQEVSLASRD